MEAIYIIAVILFVAVIYGVIDHRRMLKIVSERGKPNICEFARSFDCRDVDTQIIREVWNGVQQNLGTFGGEHFPVRAEDIFDKTYHFDPDDLDDMAYGIASKLGISTENPQKNPYWNRVGSVKNLVLFLHHQPRLKKYSGS